MGIKKTLASLVLAGAMALGVAFIGCHKQEKEKEQKTSLGIEQSKPSLKTEIAGKNLTNTQDVTESHPVFSRDGNEIFYILNQKSGGIQDVYVMNADGTNKRNLASIVSTSLGIRDMIISLYGEYDREIAFISDEDSGDEIYIMNSDGSNKRRLTNDKVMKEKLVFTSDGEQIMYIARLKNSIWRADRDGNNNKEVISHHLPITDFDWAPGRHVIAFTDSYVSPDMGIGGAVYTEKNLYLAIEQNNGWQKKLLGKRKLMTEKINPLFVDNGRGADLMYIYDSGTGSRERPRDICIINDYTYSGGPGIEKEGNEPQILAKGESWAKNLVYSQMEGRIAYTTLSSSGYQINVLGEKTLLSSKSRIDSLDFSQDGTKIVYESSGDIFLIQTDGK